MAYAMTFGGAFWGWVADFFYLPQWVQAAKSSQWWDRIPRTTSLDTEAKPVSETELVGLVDAIKLGSIAAFVAGRLLPPGLVVPSVFQYFIVALSAGCGVYLAGIMSISTEATASFKWTVMSGSLVQVSLQLLWNFSESAILTPSRYGMLASIAAFYQTRDWKAPDRDVV
eukprot:CAMPEP_0116543840 /NCGR_PEP_ID=MMETSP0397-20121206/1788_1 /TAXON_ID=216820 /ORGANISM="Cyclophora tenuis, Strain ECT3854" /LENGTH=169 /DNA_ID=CAMNT_0004067991 /DNA_START=8 /DNA_END=515 /DNA_ORIENTATION=+